jgi:hypothetical protein
MSMDTDEYYKAEELAYAKKCMLEKDLDGTACKMRFYFKVAFLPLLSPPPLPQVQLIYTYTYIYMGPTYTMLLLDEYHA